jgi:hypothetical protein
MITDGRERGAWQPPQREGLLDEMGHICIEAALHHWEQLRRKNVDMSDKDAFRAALKAHSRQLYAIAAARRTPPEEPEDDVRF